MKRLTVALALLGCTTEGQRADTGQCPSGEVCSDQTPGGLSFIGAPLGEETLGRMEPLAVAVGGTQKIRVLRAAGAGSPPFTLPFEALSSGDDLSVVGVSGPEVTVKGMKAGSAYLRIVDPDNGELFERLEVEVKAIDHADTKPRNYLYATADQEFAASPGRWLLFEGTSEPCVARLFSSSGERLADEAMSMSVVGGPGTGIMEGSRESWDTLTIIASGETSAGTVALRTGDGMTRNNTVNTVASIDNIVSVKAVGAVPSTTEPVSAGSGQRFCFRAVKGGDLVAGVVFSFTATGAATSPAGPGKNCVTLTAATPGPATLTVSAGGMRRDFVLSFVAF